MDEPRGEVEGKRPQFGNRFLTDSRNVFEHNAWDNVVWDEEQEAAARSKVQESAEVLVDPQLQEKYEKEADKFWDDFYMQHQNRFFKDRHWLFTEFPELAPKGVPLSVPVKVDTDVSGQNACEGDSQNIGIAPCIQSKSAESQIKGTLPEVDEVGSSKNVQGNDSTMPSELESCHPRQPGSGEIDSKGHTSDTCPEGEFPGSHGTTRILEVGCGVGNTVFPILQTNNDSGVFVYCCDLSLTAVELVKEHPDYSEQRCHAFVCDVTDENAEVPFPHESLDIIILIFVLSAIHPNKMQSTVDRLARFLKPGGLIVFRDYGRYDMAQLRFKKGRCLSENFYVRGDGTRVYFFTQEELRELFTKSNLIEEQNLIDRRLQVNRGRQLKMYRVWIQCKYRKPMPVL